MSRVVSDEELYSMVRKWYREMTVIGVMLDVGDGPYPPGVEHAIDRLQEMQREIDTLSLDTRGITPFILAGTGRQRVKT